MLYISEMCFLTEDVIFFCRVFFLVLNSLYILVNIGNWTHVLIWRWLLMVWQMSCFRFTRYLIRLDVKTELVLIWASVVWLRYMLRMGTDTYKWYLQCAKLPYYWKSGCFFFKGKHSSLLNCYFCGVNQIPCVVFGPCWFYYSLKKAPC